MNHGLVRVRVRVRTMRRCGATELENQKKPYCTRTWEFFMDNKNGHETDFYKAIRRIDDINLRKKRCESSQNSGVGQL